MKFYMKITIIFILTIVLFSCSNSENKTIDPWVSKSLEILEISYLGNGIYDDFTNNFELEASLFETAYILKIGSIINFKSLFHEQNSNYISNLDINKLEIVELLLLYDTKKILDLPTSEVLEKILIYINDKNIMKNEKTMNNNELLEYFYVVSEVQNFISEHENEYVTKIIDERILELLKEENRLYILNQINKFRDTWFEYNELSENIDSRIEFLFSREDINWEVYELICFVIEHDESKKQVLRDLYFDKTIKFLEQNIGNMSHSQLLNTINIIMLLDSSGNAIENTYPLIIQNINRSQIVSGGYTNKITGSIPIVYTYFNVYIRKKIGAEILTETDDYLFNNVIENINQGPLFTDWRSVYSFVQLYDHQVEKLNIIKLTIESNNIDFNKADISYLQMYYYLKSLDKLGIEINHLTIYNFVEELEQVVLKRDFKNNNLIYYLYSDLVSIFMLDHNLEVDQKIKSEIINSEIEGSPFYQLDGTENLITTIFCMLISKNLDVSSTNFENHEFLERLQLYKNINGGFSLVINGNPTLFDTVLGFMIKDLINGNEVTMLF